MQNSNTNKAQLHWPWWTWVLLIDGLLVLVTCLYPQSIALPLGWRMDFALNLSYEMNVAVWWSGGFLFCMGFLAYQLAGQSSERTQYQIAWLVMAGILVGLSFDEVGSVHERLGDWSAITQFILLGGILFSYSIFVLWRDSDANRSAVLLFLGFFLFGLVAIQEVLEHFIAWPEWMRGIRAGIEEGTELLGFILIAFSLIRLDPNGKALGNHISALIPYPSTVRWLLPLLVIGLIIHSLICLFVLPQLDDLNFRGNPGAWYPTCVFVLIAAEAYWAFHENEKNDGQRIAWAGLVVFSILCSIGTMYNLSQPWAVLGEVFPVSVQSNFPLWYGLKILMISFFCFAIPDHLSKQNIAVLFGLIVLLFGKMFIEIEIVGEDFWLSGALAFGCAVIFMKNSFSSKMPLEKNIDLSSSS